MNNQKTHSISNNLSKLYLLRGLEYAWFPIPTIILFYESHGLSLSQALLLKTILSIAILLGEIPSGYLADTYGRKTALIAGGIIWSFSWLIYCTQTTFFWFAIAEIGTGLAGSLISGADTALAFDTLLELKQQNKYRQLEGKLVAIAGISEASCGLIGGTLAGINLVYPFYLQTVCIILFSITAMTLIEPNRSLPPQKIKQLKNLSEITHFALIKNKSIKWLIIFSGVGGCATFLIVWLSQEYLKLQNISLASFGIAWAIFHLLMSLASIFATRFESILGSKKAFWTLILLIAIAYLCLALIHQKWGLVFIGLIYIARGLRTPILLNHLNHLVSSDIRATVISINSFVFRLSFVLIAPLIGWIADTYSLAVALLIFSIFFLILSVYSLQKMLSLKVI